MFVSIASASAIPNETACCKGYLSNEMPARVDMLAPQKRALVKPLALHQVSPSCHPPLMIDTMKSGILTTATRISATAKLTTREFVTVRRAGLK